MKATKSMSSLGDSHRSMDQRGGGLETLRRNYRGDVRAQQLLTQAHALYNSGAYKEALLTCREVYEIDAYRTENLLLLGAIHFQLRNFSESIFYNQQCVRVDPSYAEAFSNLGNALKELGDLHASTQFYLKAIKLKPRFGDAYNNLASVYLQLGDIANALDTYHMAITLNPTLVDAHSNMGNLYKASGDAENAKKYYLEAIRIRPDFAIAWNNLAGVFKDEGNYETAVAYYQEAIRLCPEFADAHSNLGNTLKEQQKVHEAIAAYQTAISLKPDFAIAHGNLGSCFYEIGNVEAAVRTFKYAIQLEPNFPDAYNNLGNSLRELGQLDEAIHCYRSALRLKPDHPHAYNNLGNSMKDKGLIQEAIHCYVTAIRLLPRFPAAHSNLGSILKEQGKLNQALAHYNEAITIQPTFADAYSNMGNTYKEMGQFENSVNCYLRAIELNPSFADAYCNLASVYRDMGQVSIAIENYKKALELKPNFPDAFANLIHALINVCDWSNYDQNFAQLSSILSAQLATERAVPSVQPFHALAYPLSLAEMQQISRCYAAKVSMNSSLIDPTNSYRPKPTSIRLKVGYVSSDFGNHPLSHLMQSVFGFHDRSKYEVFCYSLSRSDQSIWRQKIEQSVENFRDISNLHFGDATQVIYNDRIHVLINLNGYTKGAANEIFALQPAPLQVSYMGYCGTMGADYIQYILADRTVIPTELREFYTEKVIEMPHSYFVNDHRQSSRSCLEGCELKRSQYGLSEDKFVFCNFNQLYKIDPATFTIWCNILKRVPNSVLWLLRFPAAGEQNILSEARARGIRDEQIHFTDIAPKDEHIARGFLADLCLDTLACNSHTTACDVLWSGTPMITCPGAKMSTRVAASLLRAACLPELIAESPAAYEELAVSLAMDSERLYSLRNKLEISRETCPAFDTKRWVSNMEKGLQMAWDRHEKGMLPDHVSVVDDDAVEIGQEQLLG